MRPQLQTDEVLAATVQAHPCFTTSLIQSIKINYRRKTHGIQLEMRLVMMEVRLISCSAFMFL